MSDLSDMSTLSEPEDETGALQETNKKSQEDSSDSDSMVSDEGGPYRPCGDTHCTASKCMKNIGVGWDAEMMKMFIWVTPDWFAVTKLVHFKEGRTFWFSKDSHIEHILNAGENRQQIFEVYDIRKREWVPMMQRDCLWYSDFELAGSILMRKKGLSDGECIGIDAVVRSCHEHAWKKGCMQIPLPRRYSHPGPDTVRGLFMD